MPLLSVPIALSNPTRWLLALACALHFGMGAVLGLSVDEAHYALYAAHPALSYFDHPPLVGWVQWPLVALNAPTAVLRLLPELLWLATAVLVAQMADRLQASLATATAPTSSPSSSPAPQAGFWAVMALALAPLLHILGLGLLPDTLLMLWAAVLMLLTMELMQPTALSRTGLWVALGVTLGLAGLSKYTAIFPAAAVGVCLLRAHGLRVLRARGLWCSVLLALVLVSPVAVWNYQNHWISFTYQAQHGAGGGWQGVHALRFALLQLLVYGPLLLWAATGVRMVGPGLQRGLVLFFLFPFAVFAAMSGGGTSLPHWTAPAWVCVAPFAGLALARAVQLGRRKLLGGVLALQALACVALMAMLLTAGLPFVSGSTGRGDTQAPSNPLADVYGWDAAGTRALELSAQQGLRSVAVQNWTLASRMGWYARPLPVYVLEHRMTQFSLWAGVLPLHGDTLLVDWSQLAYEVPLGEHGFARCELLDTQNVQRLGTTISTFRFYACRDWSGSPQPRLLGTP